MIEKSYPLEDMSQFLNLDIVDWNRLNGYWSGVGDAMETVESWLLPNKLSGFMVSHCIADDWGIEPTGDFPGWEHCGGHVEIAKDYWAWFSARHPDGWLMLSDSPDFQGAIPPHWFWGDIGKVSVSAFMMSIKSLRQGDLWITLQGQGNYQSILEAQYSPFDALTPLIWGADVV